MAKRLALEMEGLPKLVKKLGPQLFKDATDKAIRTTTDEAEGVVRTVTPVRQSAIGGVLYRSVSATRVSDRKPDRVAGYVSGAWYGRFVDRGTKTIKARRFTSKARTQLEPTARKHLDRAGTAIAKEWSK